VVPAVRDDHVGEDELLRQVAGGDMRALEALYRGMRVQVFAVALAVAGDRGVAEDVVQDTFVRVYSEGNSASPPAFSGPRPGTSIAVRQVPARAAAPPAGAAMTAGGAAHHTAAAPARTSMTRCRLIGSPQHIPAAPVRSPGRRVPAATASGRGCGARPMP